MPLMRCGHVAQATRASDQAPVCVICYGINDGADKVQISLPNLEGRKAKCAYLQPCKSEENSSFTLAFFEYKPNQEYDLYYCGCHGWD